MKNKKIFFLYPNSVMRSKIKNKIEGMVNQKYAFFGEDHAESYGFEAYDDLDFCDKLEGSKKAKIINYLINKALVFLGGYGGYWYKVFKLKKYFKKTDIIFSTADRVGIPLFVLSYFKIIPRRKIVYVSIGLPERLDKLNKIIFFLYKKFINKTVNKIICYGYEEKERLEKIFDKDKVIFIPFGVDVDYFIPSKSKLKKKYLYCIGADPFRDFELLFRVAVKFKVNFKVVLGISRYNELLSKKIDIPKNVELLVNVSFDDIKDQIEQSKFVILPVKNNSYSGATTSLLQSMSMSKAVIVSKTGAIKKGYFLKDKENCLLVRPNSYEDLYNAIANLLNDDELLSKIEKESRKTILENLSWQKYLKNIYNIFNEV